jgi:hypothetical protein
MSDGALYIRSAKSAHPFARLHMRVSGDLSTDVQEKSYIAFPSNTFDNHLSFNFIPQHNNHIYNTTPL